MTLIPSLLASFCWGVIPIIYKYILNKKLASTTFLLLCHAFVYFSIIISYVFFTKFDYVKASQTNYDTLVLIILATIAGTIGQILFINTIASHTSSSYVVTSIISTSPMFTLALAYFFLGEKITLKHIIGVIAIIVGVILVAS